MSHYLKLLPSGERLFFALFEEGYFASFKIEEPKDDYLISLFMNEDDVIIDLLLPSIVARTATLVLIFRRRFSERNQGGAAGQQFNNNN
jgi:hypothetical protein